MRKPWPRTVTRTVAGKRKKQVKWYYWDDHGQCVFLALTEEEAFRQWHELQTGARTRDEEMLVVVALNRFLAWVQIHRKQRTYDWYQYFLSSFARHLQEQHRGLRVREVTPYVVTKWVDASFGTCSKSTIHSALRAVKRAFNWMVEQGLVSKCPVGRIAKSRATRRKIVITPDQYAAMLATTRDNSRPSVS